MTTVSSPTEATRCSYPPLGLLAKVLIENLGHPVTAERLIRTVWSGQATDSALRVDIFRLRRQITPLGLTITAVRGHGYVMREGDTFITAQ